MRERTRNIAYCAFGALLILLSFLLGRAEGWWEASRFMERLAEELSRIAPPC